MINKNQLLIRYIYIYIYIPVSFRDYITFHSIIAYIALPTTRNNKNTVTITIAYMGVSVNCYQCIVLTLIILYDLHLLVSHAKSFYIVEIWLN